MRNLFLFVFRYYAFFLFLLFQVMCIYLVVTNEGYHQAAFLNVADELVGRTYTVYNQATEYLRLGDENARLAQENARLHMDMPASFFTDSSTIHTKKDS